MFSEDIAAFSLCTLANGANLLGYYMYHGGNNPHSLLSDDSPETTLQVGLLHAAVGTIGCVTLFSAPLPSSPLFALSPRQESSFQPSGAANPMPSESYDFYAAIGEFGQPRQHFHQLRRHHLLLRDYGDLIAGLPSILPKVLPASLDDATTLRWAVRAGPSAGFLFVNNHQRLLPMPAKTGVRFQLRVLPPPLFPAFVCLGASTCCLCLHSSVGLQGAHGSTIDIPSRNSPPLTVSSGVFFHLPFGIATPAGVKLAWSTAQVCASCLLDMVCIAADICSSNVQYVCTFHLFCCS